MTERAINAGASIVIVGLILACDQPTTGPGKVRTSTPLVAVSLKIGGPSAIAPGETVSFTATAGMSDLTSQDYTRKVVWTAEPASVLTIIQDTGEATAHSVGDVTITALVTGSCCVAHLTTTILAPNTFRLTGKALESGLPVAGASIVVIAGTGAGLAATTDSDGVYRLYGVAGTIQIKFSKPGYDDIVKAFTATQNDVLDFPEAHQSGGVPSVAGTYTLTLTADPACPTTATRGVPPLPDDFRQPRSYAALLSQDGPAVTVTLTGSDIVSGRNQFTGRVEPGAIEFQIDAYQYYFDTRYRIAQRLSSTQEFEFGGQAHAQRSANAMVGWLDGALEIANVPGGLAAQCVATNNQVSLTRAAQPSGHR